jgi:predicted phosphodiesterase
VRYLILSDIHANLEALDAVLADAGGQYDQIVCCGDLVGYGPDPNAIVDWAREHLNAVVRGNHDKVCAGLETEDNFSPLAALSAKWTRKALTPQSRTYLADLPTGPAEVNGFHLVHGSPSDEDEYLIDLDDATLVGESVAESLYFFGHTHVQGGFRFRGKRAGNISRRHPLPLLSDERYLVNPGSVGQPRDGDPRAAYAIFENQLVDFRRAVYDAGRTARKIIDAGLPDLLALRLMSGG